jgi:hypothetical protein
VSYEDATNSAQKALSLILFASKYESKMKTNQSISALDAGLYRPAIFRISPVQGSRSRSWSLAELVSVHANLQVSSVSRRRAKDVLQIAVR